MGAVVLTWKGRGDKGGEMGDHRRLDISQGPILLRGTSLGARHCLRVTPSEQDSENTH